MLKSTFHKQILDLLLFLVQQGTRLFKKNDKRTIDDIYFDEQMGMIM